MQIWGVMLGAVVDGVSTCHFFQQLLKPIEEKSWSESTNLRTFWNHTGQDPHACQDAPSLLTDWHADQYVMLYMLDAFNWAAPKTSMTGFSIRVHVGNPPRKQNLHARKLREKSASRSSRESRGESRYIVEAHLNIHVHHYLRAIFRESNRERYYETPVTAKAKTVPAKEPRKPSRKLIRIRTKSLPGFRRRSIVLGHCGDLMVASWSFCDWYVLVCSGALGTCPQCPCDLWAYSDMAPSTGLVQRSWCMPSGSSSQSSCWFGSRYIPSPSVRGISAVASNKIQERFRIDGEQLVPQLSHSFKHSFDMFWFPPFDLWQVSHEALATREAFGSSAKVPGLSLATLPASAALPALPLPGIQLSQAKGTGQSVMLCPGILVWSWCDSMCHYHRYRITYSTRWEDAAQTAWQTAWHTVLQCIAMYCNVLQCVADLHLTLWTGCANQHDPTSGCCKHRTPSTCGLVQFSQVYRTHTESK